MIIVQPSCTNPNSTASNEINLVVAEVNRLHRERPVDLFLSLHTNAGGGTGFESFVHPDVEGARSDELRNKLHDQVMLYLKKFNITDRGKKYANFAVLRETNMPAVLLENLFIDNSKDAKYLKDETFLAGLANEIAFGLVVAMGLKRKEQGQADNTPNDLLKEMAQLREEVKLLQAEANRLNRENIELRQSLRKVAGITAPYMVN